MILITFVWTIKKEVRNSNEKSGSFDGCRYECREWAQLHFGIGWFVGYKYLWSKVATPEGYQRDPALVINFYNERRKQLLEVKPNVGMNCWRNGEKFHM
jgi:NAD-dependent deacetylase